jgi:hypothetical protein
MSTCNRLDLETLGSRPLNYTQQSPWTLLLTRMSISAYISTFLFYSPSQHGTDYLSTWKPSFEIGGENIMCTLTEASTSILFQACKLGVVYTMDRGASQGLVKYAIGCCTRREITSVYIIGFAMREAK